MSSKNFILKLIVASLLTFSSKVFAQCEFKTANYIEELNEPNSINSIEIKIPKSKKYIKNFIKIYTDKNLVTNAIPQRLKQNFDANIQVNYKFGSCVFKGQVRQQGDLLDHLKLVKGEPIRSLKVKLETGNIMNAVRFRLLIPETRNSLNEIFGTVILNELGFITPNTFEKIVYVNGTKSKMIFSEDSQKELLESHNRREGPIFSGDETLIFSEKFFDKNPFKISLSRLVNYKWFLKGKSSQNITLHSYSRMQNLYLEQVLHNEEYQNLVIDPSNNKYKFLKDYSFLLLAMNGKHGLFLNNRKFYYNSFIDEFEPIYNDGNFHLDRDSNLILQRDIKNLNLNNFNENYKFSFIDKFKNKEFKKIIFNKFNKRIVKSNKKTLRFFEESFYNLKQNVQTLQTYLDNNFHINNLTIKGKDPRKNFIKNSKKNYPEQLYLHDLKLKDGLIFARDENNIIKIYSPKEFSKIIRLKILKANRLIYLPRQIYQFDDQENISKQYFPIINAEIIHSKDLKVFINPAEKTLNFVQSKPKDWVKISNAKLIGWKIKFDGLDRVYGHPVEQRFNSYGMTGCLNFFNTNFKRSSINFVNGQCEDAINIVNSKGLIENLEISNSYQDGLDMDFSELEIKNLKIQSSGNDCLDLSGGEYSLDTGKISLCSDKGISVGEKSVLNINDVVINDTTSALTVKDLSILNVENASISGSEICTAAYQKKQEYGGGLLNINNLSCIGKNYKDNNSIANIN